MPERSALSRFRPLRARLVDWACEDANSKLVEVVTVADFDSEKHVDDSLVHI